jgi:hypothetical protein
VPITRHTKDVKYSTFCRDLFSAEHIIVKSLCSHYLHTLESPGNGLRSQLGWLLLGVGAIGPLSIWPLTYVSPQALQSNIQEYILNVKQTDCPILKDL